MRPEPAAGARATQVAVDYDIALNGELIRHVYDRNDFRPDPLQRFIVLKPEFVNSTFTNDALRTALYGDYAWALGNRVTLTPGLRWEHDGFAGQSLWSPRTSLSIDLDTVTRLTIGGGIRDTTDTDGTKVSALEIATMYFKSGADKVSINTAAVNHPEFVAAAAEKFGRQCIVVAIDAKQAGSERFEIFTHGGRKSTGIDVLKFVEEMESLGAGEILLTSMDRDGTKKGYDLDLTKKVSNLVNIPVIASGGVGNLEHLHQGIKIGKASAVLAASIFHFGEHTILEAKQYLDSKGIPVRI